MRVAVLGAGVTGLVAALRLAQRGHEPVVLERWPGLGGQAATFDVGGGHRLEHYYHHWFTSDRHVVSLCEELGVQVDWLPSSVGFFADGGLHPFTSPLDLLRFRPLPLTARVRMGLAVVRLQRGDSTAIDHEHETAATWVRREMGSAAWERVWGPLMRGKFGDRAEDVSMAWLHGKLTQRRQVRGREARREQLGYPPASFEALFAALDSAIRAAGGEVRIDAPAARVERAAAGGFDVTSGSPGSWREGHDPRAFPMAGAPEHFDAVIATVPNDVFAALAGAIVDDDLLARAASIDMHTALCLLLEVDRRVTPFYWTNVADPAVPFVGVVEHTNLVPAERYDGRRFLYLANYVAPGDPLLEHDADSLLATYEPALRHVAPGWDRAWVRERWLFREPAAQPIVDVGYRERIPPMATGVPGLVLANTTQIWPEDRGTSYSVRLGEQAVDVLLGGE